MNSITVHDNYELLTDAMSNGVSSEAIREIALEYVEEEHLSSEAVRFIRTVTGMKKDTMTNGMYQSDYCRTNGGKLTSVLNDGLDGEEIVESLSTTLDQDRKSDLRNMVIVIAASKRKEQELSRIKESAPVYINK